MSENETTLKAGDIVQLRSGGPVMTINFIPLNGAVICVWFDENEICQTANFERNALQMGVVGEAGRAMDKLLCELGRVPKDRRIYAIDTARDTIKGYADELAAEAEEAA